MALVDDIMSFLSTNMSGKTIKGDKFGPSPDDQIVIKTMPFGEPTVRSGVIDQRVMIVSRSASRATAKADIDTAYDLMQKKTTNFGSIPIQICRCTQSPYFMTVDENDRPMFGMDFLIRTKGL